MRTTALAREGARASVAALLVAALTVAGCPAPVSADEATELEQRVKSSAASYNLAVQRVEELNAELGELDGKISNLEGALPQQQERSDESIRALYRYAYDSSSMMSLLFDSANLSDMLALLDSYTWVIDSNIAEVHKTCEMRNELEDARSKAQRDREQAQEQEAAAHAALGEAVAAREQARQRALVAQQEQAQAQQEAPESSEEDKEQDATAATQASADEVGWDKDKVEFVAKWAPRIDAYLSGSPTAGTGRAYAAAAWDNGVDPRWAPAISLVESSKGAVCFRSYNAWGFGQYGFSSWEDGIETVVSALAGSLYGGYLTQEAAKTYCPPSWQSWYRKCAAEMAKI